MGEGCGEGSSYQDRAGRDVCPAFPGGRTASRTNSLVIKNCLVSV